MPDNMIRDEIGGKPNVAGSSMAMVATGPRPGKTPTAVPTKTPIRQYIRFVSVSAVSKPRARLLKISMVIPL